MTDFFPQSKLALLDKTRIPVHVGIIPDGNRRWALQSLVGVKEGHSKGADVTTDIVLAAQDLGVKAVTIYTFSTENWARPQSEIDALFLLLKDRLLAELPNLLEKGIRLKTIGNLQRFPPFLRDILEEVKNKTASGKGIDFIMALNYGGRDEICRAVKKIVDEVVKGRLLQDSISEQVIASHLDTDGWVDPELIIRTSGEMRTSNFLLWQNSYSEWVSFSKYWPEFTPNDFLDAIISYQKREKRLGE